MQSETSLVVDATRKASRFLQRDYFELENLQAGEKGTDSFCQKACGKAFQTLHEELSKNFKAVIFNNDEVAKTSFSGRTALVEILDGFNNFKRSLPFFAIMVTIVYNEDGKLASDISVINFPALGEIYYAELGKGAWMDRLTSNAPGASRARVSGMADISSALVSASSSQYKSVSEVFKNVRSFESYSYSLAMLVSGKIDALYTETRDISSAGSELFAKESGGASRIENGMMLLSNFKLHEKIKQLL